MKEKIKRERERERGGEGDGGEEGSVEKRREEGEKMRKARAALVGFSLDEE